MPLFYLAERVSSVVDEKLDVEKSERKSVSTPRLGGAIDRVAWKADEHNGTARATLPFLDNRCLF